MESSAISSKVGQRIKELRQNLSKSQEAFALDAGLDRTYIASVESGRRNISINNLQKIWNALEISPADFFDDELFR